MSQRALDIIIGRSQDEPQQMTSFPNAEGGRTVDGGGVPLSMSSRRLLPSEVPGVSDEQWTEWAIAMKTASPSAMSASGALGMFELKVRRLADLGVIRDLRNTGGRWGGTWRVPLSQKTFLASANIQYKIFVASMKKYIDDLRAGTIKFPDDERPEGMTLSGVLAILHRCGPSGLETWNDVDDRFPATVSLYEAANGIF